VSWPTEFGKIFCGKLWAILFWHCALVVVLARNDDKHILFYSFYRASARLSTVITVAQRL